MNSHEATLGHRTLRRLQRLAEAVYRAPMRLLYGHSGKLRNYYWTLRTRDIDKKWRQAQGDYPTLTRIVNHIGAKRVLDFGCGCGRLFPLFERLKVESVVGYDISGQALDECRRKFPGPRFSTISGPLGGYGYRDGYFDLIISNYTLQHIPPNEIDQTIGTLCRLASHVYINEMSQSNRTDRFFFMALHNYESVFSRYDFFPTDCGLICQDRWVLFSRAPKAAPLRAAIALADRNHALEFSVVKPADAPVAAVL
ncbi:MAG TPA: class I SAM-dependent methyltransferase [Candidatus Didemnitutus sp.]|nr:class I SAM-dependent methyltransferase [Candidatus Didemnitutus sp.]